MVASQSRTNPTWLPEARIPPCLEKAKVLARSPWLSVCLQSPVATSRSRTFPTRVVTAITFPSGEKAASPGPLPLNVCMHLPFEISHRETSQRYVDSLKKVDARTLPSDKKVTDSGSAGQWYVHIHRIECPRVSLSDHLKLMPKQGSCHPARRRQNALCRQKPVCATR